MPILAHRACRWSNGIGGRAKAQRTTLCIVDRLRVLAGLEIGSRFLEQLRCRVLGFEDQDRQEEQRVGYAQWLNSLLSRDCQ